MKQAFYFLFLLLILAGGCKQKSAAEKAFDSVQEKAEDAGEDIKEEADDADKDANKKVKKGKKSLKEIKLKLK